MLGQRPWCTRRAAYAAATSGTLQSAVRLGGEERDAGTEPVLHEERRGNSWGRCGLPVSWGENGVMQG